VVSPACVYTEIFYTPLYTYSQETCLIDNISAHTKAAHDTHPTTKATATSAEAEAAATSAKAEAKAAAAAATEARVAKAAEAEAPAAATA
jgi:hypothetical protein